MAAGFGSPLAPATRVGDAIIRFRQSAPDPCATLPIASTPQFTAIGGGTLNLSGNNFYGIQTWLTPWGETAPSPEPPPVALGVGGNNSITLPISPVPGVTRGRVYFGFGASQESQYIDIDETSMGLIQTAITNGWPGSNLVISGSGQTGLLTVYVGPATPSQYTVYNYPGIPPRKSSAFLPNTDGNDISAVMAFSWLNKAMTALSIIAGGIRDDGGVNTIPGQDQLVVPGRWLMIDDMWWDGWYVFHEHRIYTWKWGQVESVPGISSTWINGGQQAINLWPQPSSGGATTNLTAAIGPTSTIFPVLNSAASLDPNASGNGFRFPGMLQIDNELIYFSNNDDGSLTFTQFNTLVRGVGGTRPASHASGAAVTQTILQFSGRRMPALYAPGDEYTAIDLPPGWDDALDPYMLGRFKEFEQDMQSAEAFDKKFMEKAMFLKARNEGPVWPRQVGSVIGLLGEQALEEALGGQILVP